MLRPLLSATCMALLLGCGRTPVPRDPAGAPLQVLERARARPTPDPVRARLHIELRSKPLQLANGTGAVLIVDRPGRGHLAVLGPLGGPVATLTSDGEQFVVALPRERRLLVADEAQQVLVDATEGLFDLDDLIGLLLGDIPFDEAQPRSRRPNSEGLVEVLLPGPDGVRLDLLLEPVHATPVGATVTERGGKPLLVASFEPFEPRDDGTLVPTKVTLELPAVEATLKLRFKSWEVLDEVPPVFDIEAPSDDWTREPLEPWLRLSPPPDGHP